MVNKPAVVIVAEHCDLASLAQSINTEHTQAHEHLAKALEHARNAGIELQRAKDAMPHGKFLPWLKANCQFSERTARNYMLVARNWQRVADLESVREAVRVLTQSDNHFPFELPPVGQGMLGVVPDGDDMTNWIYVIVESVGEHWIRAATLGSELSFDNRGWHRDYFWAWLEVQEREEYIDAIFWASVHWFAPRPVSPANNPFNAELPWTYETAEAA